MNCKICGHPNNDEMRFCTNCGAELEAPAVQQPEQNTAQPVSQMSGPNPEEQNQLYGQQQYNQPQSQQYGQQQYGQYGQQPNQQYGQPQYGQQQYVQPPYPQYGQQNQQYGRPPYPQYGQRQMPPVRPVPRLPKKGVSKKKTLFFWISKAVIVMAIVTFFFPFMKMAPGKNYPKRTTKFFPEMTGRELVFGIDDDDSNEEGSDLTNLYVQVSAILVAIALFAPQASHFFSGISAIFLFIFIKLADSSYTFNDKLISKQKDVVEIKFQWALYVCIGLLIAATVISIIDEVKRRKIFDAEQKLLAETQNSYNQPQNTNTPGSYI